MAIFIYFKDNCNLVLVIFSSCNILADLLYNYFDRKFLLYTLYKFYY